MTDISAINGDKNRPERSYATTPIGRLTIDMKENGYLQNAIKGGRKAHTNEHILIDCVQAVLDLHDQVKKLTEIVSRLVPDRTKTIEQGQDLVSQVNSIEKRLKTIDGAVRVLMENQ